MEIWYETEKWVNPLSTKNAIAVPRIYACGRKQGCVAIVFPSRARASERLHLVFSFVNIESPVNFFSE